MAPVLGEIDRPSGSDGEMLKEVAPLLGVTETETVVTVVSLVNVVGLAVYVIEICLTENISDVEVEPPLFVAVTVTEVDAYTVDGVPLMLPSALSLSPSGKEPLVTE